MTEKTEEQIAKEREAVASMKGAKSNMQFALDRIETLETGLRNAIYALQRMKGYVPADGYAAPGSTNLRKLHAVIDDDIATAQAKLR